MQIDVQGEFLERDVTIHSHMSKKMNCEAEADGIAGCFCECRWRGCE